jgi:hypothetical protein
LQWRPWSRCSGHVGMHFFWMSQPRLPTTGHRCLGPAGGKRPIPQHLYGTSSHHCGGCTGGIGACITLPSHRPGSQSRWVQCMEVRPLQPPGAPNHGRTRAGTCAFGCNSPPRPWSWDPIAVSWWQCLQKRDALAVLSDSTVAAGCLGSRVWRTPLRACLRLMLCMSVLALYPRLQALRGLAGPCPLCTPPLQLIDNTLGRAASGCIWPQPDAPSLLSLLLFSKILAPF